MDFNLITLILHWVVSSLALLLTSAIVPGYFDSPFPGAEEIPPQGKRSMANPFRTPQYKTL